MPKTLLAQISRYCDRLLRTKEFTDYDDAFNGLQVENSGTVTRIAAAVDASLATVRLAATSKADLLIVHHGLFWTARHPWTGQNLGLLRALLEQNLAVYSSHLPLDAHPKLGNNAQLCAALGLKPSRRCFECKGQPIGFEAHTHISRDQLAKRLKHVLGGPVKAIPGGPLICKRLGIVTGGAGNELRQAADWGLDTFVTGEGAHWTFAMAEELGLNVFYGGHYATETYGVRALASHLSRKFGVPWVFLDHPTGL